MKYLSVCSGIEAASVAWHPLGWEPVGFSEIEPFPSAVLAHHYPHVPNFGDMTKFQEWPLDAGAIDLLVGGTPCQSFSVAGLRQGLRDPRGNLMLTYLAIAARLRPRWVVWENVPGVLSSSGGRDFGSFLGGLRELGYQYAYRVLDAQWCRTHGHPRAVPQRRRRVFVVGCLGDATAAATVLLKQQSVLRNSKTRGTAREEIASDVEGRVGAGCWQDVAETLIATDYKGPGHNRDHNFISQPFDHAIPLDLRNSQRDPEKHDAQNRQGLGVGSVGDPAPTVDASFVHGVACFKSGQGAKSRSIGYSETVSPTLPSNAGGNTTPSLLQAMTVRRLTPKECERLQGFSDDYTLIPWRKKAAGDCPDGPRYKALGNSMAVNCMEWIGERIAAVEAGEDK